MLATFAGRVLAEGATDTTGQWPLRIELPPRTPLGLLVSADGFAIARQDLPAVVPEHIEVLLEEEAVIRGRVTGPGSAAPPAGTRVFAWSSASYPPTGRFALFLRGAPGTLHATVDAGGSFELRGVSPSRSYTLAAGAPGWCSVEPARRVLPGGEPVHLGLWRVYGCVLRAQSDRGTPPSHLGSIDTTYPERRAWRVLQVPSLELCLAGIPDVPGVRDQGFYDWRTHLVVLAAERDLPTLGGIGIRYDIPGFQETSVDLALPALEGSFPEKLVRLAPDTNALGSLRLRLTGIPAVEGYTVNYGTPPAHLELVGQDQPPRTFRVAIDPISARSVEVAGIPAGTYRVRLLPVGGGAYPNRTGQTVRIHAGPDHPELVLDLSTHGTLLLVDEHLDTTARRTALHVVARRSGGRLDAEFTISMPPYVLSGLMEGTYDLTISCRDADGEVRRTTLSAVRVRGSEVTEAMFSWKP